MNQGKSEHPAPYYTKIDSRGRLWVNKAFRDKLGLPTGGKVEFFTNEEGLLALRAAKLESTND